MTKSKLIAMIFIASLGAAAVSAGPAAAQGKQGSWRAAPSGGGAGAHMQGGVRAGGGGGPRVAAPSGPRMGANTGGGRRWSGRPPGGSFAGQPHRRHGFHRGFGFGFAFGATPYFATPYYDEPYYYYDDGYADDVVPADDAAAVAYCKKRFKSYDVTTGTYLGYDGLRHPCP